MANGRVFAGGTNVTDADISFDMAGAEAGNYWRRRDAEGYGQRVHHEQGFVTS